MFHSSVTVVVIENEPPSRFARLQGRALGTFGFTTRS